MPCCRITSLVNVFLEITATEYKLLLNLTIDVELRKRSMSMIGNSGSVKIQICKKIVDTSYHDLDEFMILLNYVLVRSKQKYFSKTIPEKFSSLKVCILNSEFGIVTYDILTSCLGTTKYIK